MLDSHDAARLADRLDVRTSRLVGTFTPQACKGRPILRRLDVQLDTLKQAGLSVVRRVLRPGTAQRREDAVRALYEGRWKLAHGVGPRTHEKIVEFSRRLLVVPPDEEPFLNWFYVLALAELLAVVGPRRVLEVGSGNGFNTNSLALLFPECEFCGLELTSAGVDYARAAHTDADYRERLVRRYSRAWDAPRRAGVGRATFCRGNAARLPFASGSFDVVFSVLALEQMSRIQEPVLAEMARVTRMFTVHIEPFADFNRGPFRRLHLWNKDYFRSPISRLNRFGLRPAFTWAGFPTKLHYSAGLLVARKQP